MPEPKSILPNNTITTIIIDMQVELHRITDIRQIENIRELYISAFPANERREFENLVKLLSVADCSFFRIFIRNDLVAGFCIVWEFGDFVFIEHFAVAPYLRGLGIGEKTLAEIKSLFQKTIILETELPTDETSRRRISFYERNGFHKLNRTYFQPSYGENKPPVELKLMCNCVDFTTEELDKYISVIRTKVYRIQ